MTLKEKLDFLVKHWSSSFLYTRKGMDDWKLGIITMFSDYSLSGINQFEFKEVK